MASDVNKFLVSTVLYGTYSHKVLSKECNSYIHFTLSEPYEGRTDFVYNNLLKAQVGL